MTTFQTRARVLWASPSPRLKPSTWCTVVSRGDEAVKAFHRDRHDLVMCDMRGLADGMNGSRLYQALRAIDTAVRMVLLSPGYVGQAELAVAGGRVQIIDPTDGAIQKALASVGIYPESHGAASAPEKISPLQRPAQNSQVQPGVTVAAISKALAMFVGPLAEMEVEEAVDRLKSRGIKTPSGADVAKEAATSIPDKEARAQFIALVFSTQQKK